MAQAILQGVNSTKSSSKLQHLTNIRIVLIKIDIFLAFKKQALQMFPHAVINTGNVKSALDKSVSFFHLGCLPDLCFQELFH